MSAKRRISVVGVSGAGKTTTARRIAARLGIRHVELDALYHQAGWRPRPREELREVLRPLLDEDGWVVDGNYTDAARDLVWGQADTVVWLDLPRRVVLPAILWRSVRRGLRGEELWNGNRERLWKLLDPRPEENIVLWSATRFGSTRARYASDAADPAWAGLTFHRLRSRAEIDRLIAGLAPG